MDEVLTEPGGELGNGRKPWTDPEVRELDISDTAVNVGLGLDGGLNPGSSAS